MNNGSQIHSDNFNDLFLGAAFTISEAGEWTKPRGYDCKELLNAQLILTNPKNCLVTIKKRKLNYAYLIVEKFMYLSGFQDPEILIAYNGRMKDFLNTATGLFDGAYGPRVSQGDQLNYCYMQLKEDIYSRQAVITINDYTDRRVSLDKPCTLSWQFLIRNKQLYMTANMRSNDLMWGTCLDIPAFCFIGEVMAYWLGVEFKEYTHNAASLHYYKDLEKDIMSMLQIEKQFDNYHALQNFNEVNDKSNPEWTIDYSDTRLALKEFWKQEKNIRENLKFEMTDYPTINGYLARLLNYWTNKNERRNIAKKS